LGSGPNGDDHGGLHSPSQRSLDRTLAPAAQVRTEYRRPARQAAKPTVAWRFMLPEPVGDIGPSDAGGSVGNDAPPSRRLAMAALKHGPHRLRAVGAWDFRGLGFQGLGCPRDRPKDRKQPRECRWEG